MMFLLDTNVVSELRKKQRCDRQVWAWAERHNQSQFYLSAITVLEIELGILRLEHRDLEAGKALRHWFEGTVLTHFAERILVIDTNIVLRCAQLHIPDPRSERDALIAATASVHKLVLVTRNVRDFSNANITVFDPWQAAT